MGSEIPPLPPEAGQQTGEPSSLETQSEPVIRFPEVVDDPRRKLLWVFIGDEGLRAGWSLAIFIGLFFLFGNALRYGLHWAHVKLPSRSSPLSPKAAFAGELMQVLLLILVAWVVSRIERRKLLDYNLRGPRPLTRFAVGLVTGFVAISLLVAGLSAGGWIQFGPLALSGSQIVYYALAWAATFLLVGCFEEGLTRCYLLFTLGRGLNFWWGLGLVAGICLLVSLNTKA